MRALTEEFLYELYGTAIESEKVAAAVVTHLDRSYLPNKHFQKVHGVFESHWIQHKEPPTYGIMSQMLSEEPRCSRMLSDFKENASDNVDATLDTLEKYIKGVVTKQTLQKCILAHNNGESDESASMMTEYAKWMGEFSLKPSTMVDVFGTFETRYKKNAELISDDENKSKPIYRFYINELDRLNGKRNLRGQLTVALAPSGVGKSHFARHIGEEASVSDGLDVLHIQLEGTEKEVTDAYSASLAGYNASYFEQADIPDDEMAKTIDKIKSVSGNLMVKSYSKFGINVNTMDVRTCADDFLESVGKYPDIILVDSMDLLESSRKGGRRVREELRHDRLKVAQDLKNIAMELDCWVFATYQATIESPETLNDESKTLTEYHLSEAKGIIRPLTHLITLNQSEAEKEENTMRLFVAKSRFFSSGQGLIKIKCDYDRGKFYDADATLRLLGT